MKITLCGSTRFMEAFGDWDIILTKAGHVVYTVARSSHGEKTPTPEEKRRFDLVHLEKINASDAIVVLNVGGYYGESTEREIEWARMQRKDVYWLENRTPRVDDKSLNVPLGPSVWTIYALFDGGLPISTIPEAEKYAQPSGMIHRPRPMDYGVKGSMNG